MSTILEEGDFDVDIELTPSVEYAEDSFMVLNAGPAPGVVDETSPPEESHSEAESSDSSFLDISDLDDEIEVEEIDTTESIEIDEHHVNQEVDVEATEESHSKGDLRSSFPGMYRILDLISERGSSGLVDKIIIDQDSLKCFLNEISPNTYMSLTKVDFKVLDKFQVKPIGIYGSKEEIVRFLVSVAVIDDAMAAKLITSPETRTEKPALRSGLYICRVSESVGAVEKMYVVYWPEESTWDDDASPPVRRNRVTFMRYLTTICDQVTALISKDHAESMIWSNPISDDQLSDSDEDDTDRLFTFEVAKTNQQEEGVSVRQGFDCASDELVAVELHPQCNLDSEFFQPRLLFGETRQGFLTTRYVPPKISIKALNSFRTSAFLLQDSLLKERLQISESINIRALNSLVRLGLSKRFPDECGIWMKEVNTFRSACLKDMEAQQKNAQNQLSDARAQTESSIRFAVVNAVFSGYPTLDRSRCFASVTALTADEESKLNESYFNITTIHPRIAESLTDELRGANCKKITDISFRKSKEKILLILYLSRNLINMTETQITKLVRSVSQDERRQLQNTLASILHEIAMPADATPRPTQAETQRADKMLKEGSNESSLINDPDFVADLESISSTMPMLKGTIMDAHHQVQKYLGNTVDKICRTLLSSARRIQLEDIQVQLKLDADRRSEQVIRELGRSLIQKLNSLSEACDSAHTLRLKYVLPCRNFGHHSDRRSQNFDITGQRETQKEASLLFTIHLMHLTTQDQHELQLDPTKVPSPHFKESYTFQVPIGFSISHSQLLEGDRLLLVLVDRTANLHLHLDHLNNIENSIGRGHGKLLHRNKIGDEFLLAFDESQAMLALISCDKLQLNVFVHDESRGFTASASTINLNPWYGEGTTIKKACFTSGSEELLLIDSQAIARVFSLTTMQFRPASLDLHHVPVDVHSSPDGSCFLIVTPSGSISAYHWSTFGSANGISLPIADWAGGSKLVISSLVRRSTVYLLKLDLLAHTCSSVALNITRKVTEFMFMEKDSRGALSRDARLTVHNCLMDCHADVWTRYPVLPAVQRATISSNDRCRRSILFVTDRDHDRYQPHFADMIEIFERTTKKPTGDKLNTLQVSAMAFDSFIANFPPSAEWNNTSTFKVGEWVVDILCLIPIHLALARDNRFVPLKDGVYSVEVEKSLLGAEINRIVDSISFGWYESIFQSYMADKPVRVVSSMGEQSVGKSFTLNHLVDTSFAGSAMRTTEGVWMSVTPTKEALIVALDFEGVHSIERSTQEDTLLVLFNTAISNLVLFRNNFALSRDITGLFQSFQSSSTVLDPVANPSLFQSTLIIIIKDVVDSDKTEIAREFSLKFQQIVEEEQDANFISRLHGGKLNIIPWPVIESREFYKLFPTLKRRLDQQDVTHKAAGEFLHLMKTLMAKLKANDWGALTQNMASHRAQLLLSLLPTALAFGMQELEPEIELLKNLDTDMPIDCSDSDARFFVANVEHSQDMTTEEVLHALVTEWDEFDSRQLVPDTEWTQELARHLEDLAEMRIDHVRVWVKSNLMRFQAGHASVVELERTLESAAIDLKSSVQLCRMQCGSCQLFCIQNRFHEDAHDCKTGHTCTQSCEYCAEPDSEGEEKKCSMIAGHSGKHICSVNIHLCGAPCKLQGKNGCLEECAKVSGHDDDDHQCAADTHACGEPCDLCALTTADGWYKCKGRCRISVDVEHESHQCDIQYCPIPCQLCKRLCSSPNHLHALEEGTNHLCGKPHTCNQRCSAPGVCEIDMAPESIEETFRGRHECFQYTKYSQVAKRLKCIKLIPPGQLQHEGSHDHSLDPDVVHYCQARCTSCQYYCTLLLGHSQQEHETSHGSMSNVRWSVDGPDDEGLEVEGRRFSTNDEGVPMMCSLVCKSLGRHVHIDYCRAKTPAECRVNNEVEHIIKKLQPEPDRPKDFLTHNLFWKRSGFKDPYSREDQTNFAKCDSMCVGTEHAASRGKPATPSFCILPLFHARLSTSRVNPAQGYISGDGHQFLCKNPSSVRQPFHIIFLIDRSMSMNKSDKTPLENSPVSGKIRRLMNNRLGAVYSALHSFWSARQTAGLRDANTIILHAERTQSVCENDTTSSPNELLDFLLPNSPKGGNSFGLALKAAETAILKWWDDARPPVIIFLSDGIASCSDRVVQKLFQKTAQKGKGLSLHAILFGPKVTSARMKHMVTVALDAQSKTPALTSAPSSFHEAIDSVQLSETFLGIAESLRKPRGALMQ